MVEYADDTGAPLVGYTMQYVPYTVQDDARYATVLSGVNKSDEDVFVGWTCDTTRDGKAIDVGVGTLVGTYGGALDYGYNRLKGSYVKVGHRARVLRAVRRRLNRLLRLLERDAKPLLIR